MMDFDKLAKEVLEPFMTAFSLDRDYENVPVQLERAIVAALERAYQQGQEDSRILTYNYDPSRIRA